MSGHDGKSTSGEVANEAEDVRANLAHTLEQLRENLKSEHVIEEVVGNARIGANSIADHLYVVARENPIPALLIGAGCAMVLGLGTRISSRRVPMIDVSPADPSSARRDRAGLGETAAASRSKSWSPYRRVEPRPHGSTLYDGLPTIAQDTMDRSTDDLKRTASRATSRLAGMFHDQPLIIAALGVAVGAAIGAALPGTDVEDEWMGGTSSSVKHAAQDAARSEIDELRAVASRTADNLRASAADHGLSGENIGDFVRDAGEHAKSAIHDVGSSIDPHRVA